MKKIPLSSPTYGFVSSDRFLAQFERFAKAKKDFQSEEKKTPLDRILRRN
jgi:hypothetical protein